MTDNQKIFEYLHKGDDKACWHEFVEVGKKPVYFGRDETSIPLYRCACGEECSGIVPDNPDYTTERGFFLLLEGLRAKDGGYRVRLQMLKNGWAAWIFSAGELLAEATADTPHVALVQAVLALIEKDGEI